MTVATRQKRESRRSRRAWPVTRIKKQCWGQLNFDMHPLYARRTKIRSAAMRGEKKPQPCGRTVACLTWPRRQQAKYLSALPLLVVLPPALLLLDVLHALAAELHQLLPDRGEVLREELVVLRVRL